MMQIYGVIIDCYVAFLQISLKKVEKLFIKVIQYIIFEDL